MTIMKSLNTQPIRTRDMLLVGQSEVPVMEVPLKPEPLKRVSAPRCRSYRGFKTPSRPSRCDEYLFQTRLESTIIYYTIFHVVEQSSTWPPSATPSGSSSPSRSSPPSEQPSISVCLRTLAPHALTKPNHNIPQAAPSSSPP